MTKNKKGLFMKIIVIYCLAFVAVTNLLALYIAYKTGFDSSGIITNINAVHGGELMLCCIKRILAKDNKTELNSNLNSSGEEVVLNEIIEP